MCPCTAVFRRAAVRVSTCLRGRSGHCSHSLRRTARVARQLLRPTYTPRRPGTATFMHLLRICCVFVVCWLHCCCKKFAVSARVTRSHVYLQMHLRLQPFSSWLQPFSSWLQPLHGRSLTCSVHAFACSLELMRTTTCRAAPLVSPGNERPAVTGEWGLGNGEAGCTYTGGAPPLPARCLLCRMTAHLFLHLFIPCSCTLRPAVPKLD